MQHGQLIRFAITLTILFVFLSAGVQVMAQTSKDSSSVDDKSVVQQLQELPVIRKMLDCQLNPFREGICIASGAALGSLVLTEGLLLTPKNKELTEAIKAQKKWLDWVRKNPLYVGDQFEVMGRLNMKIQNDLKAAYLELLKGRTKDVKVTKALRVARATAAGMIGLAVVEAFLEELANPSPAWAAGPAFEYVSSPEGFLKFLSLPESEQKELLKHDKLLRDKVNELFLKLGKEQTKINQLASSIHNVQCDGSNLTLGMDRVFHEQVPAKINVSRGKDGKDNIIAIVPENSTSVPIKYEFAMNGEFSTISSAKFFNGRSTIEIDDPPTSVPYRGLVATVSMLPELEGKCPKNAGAPVTEGTGSATTNKPPAEAIK